jgi:dsDNA-specific endonuclease/ATPase MutS2
MNPTQTDSPIEWPVDGVLDLHLFRPSEVGDLVPEYLRACQEKGILEVRIVHGKGTGQLRASVHAILKRLPCVQSFALAPSTAGGWGATIVRVQL